MLQLANCPNIGVLQLRSCSKLWDACCSAEQHQACWCMLDFQQPLAQKSLRSSSRHQKTIPKSLKELESVDNGGGAFQAASTNSCQ